MEKQQTQHNASWPRYVYANDGGREVNGAVDAILMASGFSSRYPAGDKLLLPFRGMPLAEYALKLACSLPELARVYFVAAQPGVLALADGYSAVAVENRRPERGVRESIRLGVTLSDVDYYLFFPCDQPLLDGETVRSVLACRAPGRIVIPVCGSRPGNPVLFHAAFREELLSLSDGESGRAVRARHPEAARTVSVPDARVFEDIDNEADYIRLLN